MKRGSRSFSFSFPCILWDLPVYAMDALPSTDWQPCLRIGVTTLPHEQTKVDCVAANLVEWLATSLSWTQIVACAPNGRPEQHFPVIVGLDGVFYMVPCARRREENGMGHLRVIAVLLLVTIIRSVCAYSVLIPCYPS